jgi:formylglycine-generating enzyme required for sulfatase activity
MTRRGILVGGIGTVLGISGCQAVTKSVVVASSKAALDSTASFEQKRLDAEAEANAVAEVKKNGLRLEPVGERPKDALVNFPALQAYVKGLKDIPAGSFRYGFFHGQSEAAPSVDVSAFRMGSTPVTWAMWKEYCRAESVSLPEEPAWGRLDNHPVVFVSHDDIVGTNGGGGFCGWASRVSGINLRLPASKEYEYACRGGKDGFDYPWGDTFDVSYLYCRLSDNDQKSLSTGAVDRVERIYINGFGLTDMVGNVLAWCSKDSGGDAEVRSVGWKFAANSIYLSAGFFMCEHKIFLTTDKRTDALGFRLAAGPK